MANVKNLFINVGEPTDPPMGTLPKYIWYNGKRVKNFFYNNQLVWKNSDLFKFVESIGQDPSKYEENTIIFEGFGNVFDGEYKTVENESEIDLNDKGQMYVEVKNEKN